MNQEQARKLGLELLDKCQIVYLATTDLDGQPEVRALMSVGSEKFDVMMATGASSRKIKHIQKDPRVCAYMLDEKDMQALTIFGEMEVVDDKELKQKLWRDEWVAYFKSPEDPEYAVIRVKAKKAKVLDKMEVVEFKV